MSQYETQYHSMINNTTPTVKSIRAIAFKSILEQERCVDIVHPNRLSIVCF